MLHLPQPCRSGGRLPQAGHRECIPNGDGARGGAAGGADCGERVRAVRAGRAQLRGVADEAGVTAGCKVLRRWAARTCLWQEGHWGTSSCPDRKQGLRLAPSLCSYDVCVEPQRVERGTMRFSLLRRWAWTAIWQPIWPGVGGSLCGLGCLLACCVIWLCCCLRVTAWAPVATWVQHDLGAARASNPCAASWWMAAPMSTSSALRAARARWRRGWAARCAGMGLQSGHMLVCSAGRWVGEQGAGLKGSCCGARLCVSWHPWLCRACPFTPACGPPSHAAALPERVWRRHPHGAAACHWPQRAGQWHSLLPDRRQPRGAVGGSGPAAACRGCHLPQVN